MTSAWPRFRAGLLALTCVLAVSGCGDDGAEQPDGPGSATDTSDVSSDGPTDAPAPSDTPSGTPSDTSSSSPTDGPRTEPPCDSIWVEGARFKSGYKGCYNGERWVKARPFYCSFGGKLFTYDQHFWATPNKPVRHAPDGLSKDPDYRQALAACTA